MDEINRIDELRRHGRMRWRGDEQGWVGRPEDIVDALARDGFQEYKREEARTGRDREPHGGMWQGINPRTGAVASAIWVTPEKGSEPIVFIDIDGTPLSSC
jgi:hypothetical protein